MADPLLLGPAALFVAATAYGTAVAATRPGLAGEVFGTHLRGQVRTHLALGLGSAVSAPWPMPALALWAAVRGARSSRWSAVTVTVVGSGVLAGTLAEPVTWGRRPAPWSARLSIPLHLAVDAALVGAGARRLRQQAGSARTSRVRPGSGPPRSAPPR